MKKLSIVLVVLGCILIGFGIINVITNSQDEEIDENALTEKEKEAVLSYLSNKYNKDFIFVDRINKFCIIQDENGVNGSNYIIDDQCTKHQITDYIYKIKDQEGLEFYVKDVVVEDNVTLFDSLKNTQSSGYYDNYTILYLLKKYNSLLLEKFTFLNNIKDSYIYSGLSIEDIHSGDNKHLYLNMGIDTQEKFEMDMTLEDLIDKSTVMGYSINVGFYIKAEMDLDESNFASIVNSIIDNDVYNLGYELVGKTIIIEFNNKRCIKLSDGLLLSVYEYKNNAFDEEVKKLFESIVINNDSFSDEGITLSEFNKLEQIEFNK